MLFKLMLVVGSLGMITNCLLHIKNTFPKFQSSGPFRMENLGSWSGLSTKQKNDEHLSFQRRKIFKLSSEKEDLLTIIDFLEKKLQVLSSERDQRESLSPEVLESLYCRAGSAVVAFVQDYFHYLYLSRELELKCNSLAREVNELRSRIESLESQLELSQVTKSNKSKTKRLNSSQRVQARMETQSTVVSRVPGALRIGSPRGGDSGLASLTTSIVAQNTEVPKHELVCGVSVLTLVVVAFVGSNSKK